MQILDSGERRQFNSGAVRDIQIGKGRADLLPLKEVSDMLLPHPQDKESPLVQIDLFMKSGDTKYLNEAVRLFIKNHTEFSAPAFMLEVSKHYEQGAQKYGERNWEKGIPLHCYIDSGVRHFLKHIDRKAEEAHDRAFVWNMLGAVWTVNNRPDCIDIPFELLGKGSVNKVDKKK